MLMRMVETMVNFAVNQKAEVNVLSWKNLDVVIQSDERRLTDGRELMEGEENAPQEGEDKADGECRQGRQKEQRPILFD